MKKKTIKRNLIKIKNFLRNSNKLGFNLLPPYLLKIKIPARKKLWFQIYRPLTIQTSNNSSFPIAKKRKAIEYPNKT
jgi:hypothetical protein